MKVGDKGAVIGFLLCLGIDRELLSLVCPFVFKNCTRATKQNSLKCVELKKGKSIK